MCLPKFSNITIGKVYGIFGLVLSIIGLIGSYVVNHTNTIQISDVFFFVVIGIGLLFASTGIILITIGKTQEHLDKIHEHLHNLDKEHKGE